MHGIIEWCRPCDGDAEANATYAAAIGLCPVTRYTVAVQPILGASMQRSDTTVTITVQTLPPGQFALSLSVSSVYAAALNQTRRQI